MHARTLPAPPVAVLASLFAFAFAVLLAGCGSDETVPCETNADCREGFQCGAGPFEGECIQIVSVIPCGAAYCEKATHTCENGACVPRAGGADATVGPGGPDVGPPTAPPTSPPTGPGPGDAGPVDDGGATDARTFDDAFEPPPAAPPTIVVQSPADGEIIIGRPVELSGRVFGLTAAGRVGFTLDDMPPARPLVLEGDTFQAALTLPPGRHAIVLTATNGGPEGQATVTFRYDVRIVRDGDRLLADGAPWRFIGLQTPSLRELAYQAGLGGTDRVPEVVGEAMRMGARVLRVPACDDRPGTPAAIQTAPNTYNEAALVALDAVIVQAGDAGLKLLLPLVDAGDGLGGVNQYLRWHGYLVPVPTDKRFFFAPGEIREHFKTYVRMVMGRTNSLTGVRYADDPTILGWEIFTRGDAYGVFDAASAGAEVADFVSDLTQVMKAAAPEAIIGTGEVGFDVNPSPYGRTVDPFREIGLTGPWDASHGFAWQRNLRTGTVDFAGLQVLPDLIGISSDALLYANLGAEWIRGHAAIAASERKPLIVTHAGVSTVFLTPETRRAAAQAWLDEHAARGFTGMIVGNLHPDQFDRRADPYGFAWVENTDAADPQNELVPVVQTAASRLAAE